MIKKILYTIGFLMFSTAVVQPLIALGQEAFSGAEEDVPFSTGRLFSKVSESAGLNPNADWTTTFGTTDEDEVGKDLYLIVWNKVQNQPILEANRNIAGNYGMTQAELVRVLQNDFTTILARKPTITQEEALEKVMEIQQKYKREKELLSLKASVSSAVETTEMFANGDLSDSGFDLIHDLRIIEELLFLHTEPVDVGGSWFPDFGRSSDGSGTAGDTETPDSAVTGPAEAPVRETRTPGIETEEESPTATAEAPATGTGTATGTETPAAIGAAAGADAETGALNPNSCFDDNIYDEAFANFEENAASDPNLIDRAGITGPAAGVAGATEAAGSATGADTDTAGAARTGSGIGASTSGAAAGDDFFPDLTKDLPVTPVSPAEADDWSKELPCNDLYCLTINYIMEPMTSRYQDPDNCIACHAEKINDVLWEVVTHSLVPSKAPGNLGESASCKKAVADAFGSINMNFYAIAMPVSTPINDDLIWGTSLEKEWYNFCSQAAFFPFDECKDPEKTERPVSQHETTPSFVDEYSQRVVTMAAEGTTQTDIIEEIETGRQMKAEQVSKESAAVVLEQKNDLTLVSLDPLLTEMDQMNYYFINIRNILQSLHMPVADLPGPQACTDIKNKKECE